MTPPELVANIEIHLGNSTTSNVLPGDCKSLCFCFSQNDIDLLSNNYGAGDVARDFFHES